MDEQTRRNEILQAEEAIRRLAGEMARATAAADGAESARQRFDQATALLADARTRVTAAVEQAGAAGESSRAATQSALAEAQRGLRDSTERLGGALARFDEVGLAVQSAVGRVNEAVSAAVAVRAAAEQSSRQTVEQVRAMLADVGQTIAASGKESLEQSRRGLDESAAAFVDARTHLAKAAESASGLAQSARQAMQDSLDAARVKFDAAGEKVAASVRGLDEATRGWSRIGEEIVAKHSRLVQGVESRLGELSVALSAMSMAIGDLKQQSSNNPTRLDQAIAAGLSRQTRTLVWTVLVTAFGLGVALVLCYVLFHRLV